MVVIREIISMVIMSLKLDFHSELRAGEKYIHWGFVRSPWDPLKSAHVCWVLSEPPLSVLRNTWRSSFHLATITLGRSFLGMAKFKVCHSLAYLVVPNTEDQFSQPFLALSKIWQLFQDPVIITPKFHDIWTSPCFFKCSKRLQLYHWIWRLYLLFLVKMDFSGKISHISKRWLAKAGMNCV